MTRSIERREPPVSTAVLWYAFMAPPIAWTAHLLASYPLVPLSCELGTTAILNGITVLTAALSFLAALAGWHGYRRASNGGPGGLGDASHRTRFMGAAGIIMGIFFGYVILIEGTPPIIQDPCIQGY